MLILGLKGLSHTQAARNHTDGAYCIFLIKHWASNKCQFHVVKVYMNAPGI